MRLENPQAAFAPWEVGVCKTIAIPEFRPERSWSRRTLRFIADETAWDDVLEVDIDGNRLGQGSMRFESKAYCQAFPGTFQIPGG